MYKKKPLSLLPGANRSSHKAVLVVSKSAVVIADPERHKCFLFVRLIDVRLANAIIAVSKMHGAWLSGRPINRLTKRYLKGRRALSHE